MLNFVDLNNRIWLETIGKDDTSRTKHLGESNNKRTTKVETIQGFVGDVVLVDDDFIVIFIYEFQIKECEVE